MGFTVETRSDCDRCAALCCIAFPAESAEGFAASKPGGEPCPKLQAGGNCSIYDLRREEGFGGCVGFECFGAGQYVTQHHGGNRNWQADRELLDRMVDSFLTIRRAFELLWLADHAAQDNESESARAAAQEIAENLREVIARHDWKRDQMALPAFEKRLRVLLPRP